MLSPVVHAAIAELPGKTTFNADHGIDRHLGGAPFVVIALPFGRLLCSAIIRRGYRSLNRELASVCRYVGRAPLSTPDVL